MREIIHADFQGQKFVAVGNQLFFAPRDGWKTFPDFLVGYLKTILGENWGKEQLQKPLGERHQILAWYDGLCRFQAEQSRPADGIFKSIPNGDMAAFLYLSYDLYTLRHHSALQESLLERLRTNDQFQGARYELFVSATCIRAGFDIRYEDESDRSRKHPEFIAVHREYGERISVEAKSRHRPGVLRFPGQSQQEATIKAGIGRLLSKAFAKANDLPHVVFVDLNLPPADDPQFLVRWGSEIDKTVNRLSKAYEDRKTPYNLLLFTNHPHHYGRNMEPDPKKHTYVLIPESPRIKIKEPELIRSIFEAARKYGKIPNEFPADDR